MTKNNNNISMVASDTSSITIANTTTTSTGSAGNRMRAPTKEYRNRKAPRTSNRDITQFQGETEEMNGHVFQIHSEQKKKGQFQDTIDALKVYASLKYYTRDIKFITPLFRDLEEPFVPEPEEPIAVAQKDAKGANIKSKDGQTVQTVSKFADMVFQEQVKQWINDTTSLRATLQSLYNIVWGQCSKLMQNQV